MAQATYSIRLDQDKKAKFDKICDRLGLSASSAISVFVSQTVEDNGLPFLPHLKPSPSEYGILEEDKLSHDELMAVVQESLNSVDTGKTYSIEEAFDGIAEGRYARV